MRGFGRFFRGRWPVIWAVLGGAILMGLLVALS